MQKGIDHIGISIVYFCHDGAGNFVMAKRSENCRDEHNRWDTGGGALEFGDKIEERLRQEIMEEYCTDVLAYEFLGVNDVHRIHAGKNTHWIALNYKVLVDKTKVRNGEPEIHTCAHMMSDRRRKKPPARSRSRRVVSRW